VADKKDKLDASREMMDYTPGMMQSLSEEGYNPRTFRPLTPAQKKQLPYTLAGATNLQGIAALPMDKNTGGSTLRSSAKSGRDKGASLLKINSNPNPYSSDFKGVAAHEAEHVLGNQGLGVASNINGVWDSMLSGQSSGSRNQVVNRLVEHAPYLQEKWGLAPVDVKEGYFSSNIQGRRDSPNFLYEQLATLSALEQAQNKRLTDDPYVRKHILKTPDERAAYNAVTGLRQSRLDAKDLPPYTMQPDKTDPLFLDRIKQMMGFANGGMIPDQSRQKLI